VEGVVEEGLLCLLIHRMRCLFPHKGTCIPIRHLVQQDPQAEEDEIIDIQGIVMRELKVMVTVMVMAIHTLMDMDIILPTRVLGAE
jgi:hypothetical protein